MKILHLVSECCHTIMQRVGGTVKKPKLICRTCKQSATGVLVELK